MVVVERQHPGTILSNICAKLQYGIHILIEAEEVGQWMLGCRSWWHCQDCNLHSEYVVRGVMVVQKLNCVVIRFCDYWVICTCLHVLSKFNWIRSVWTVGEYNLRLGF